MSKKLSKEQLESDILVTGYARTLDYIQHHQNTIILVIVAIFIISGGFIGLYFYNQSNENKGQAMLIFPEQFFNASEYEKALHGDNTTFTPGYIDIINTFNGTEAANIARYFAAVAELRLGNNEEALAYISKYKPTKGIMGVGPISMHGVILENLGKFDEATAIYRKAANWDKNESTTPLYLYRAAHTAYKSGDFQLAENLSKEIIDQFANSSISAQAQQILGLARVSQQ